MSSLAADVVDSESLNGLAGALTPEEDDEQAEERLPVARLSGVVRGSRSPEEKHGG